MKKILLLILVVTLISGCSTVKIKDTGYTFTDALGREVTVSSYERTAVLLGSFAEIWQLAGGKICATANDSWEDFNLELSEDCVNLGKLKKLSLEKLFESKPEFVIASANTKQHVEWKDSLTGAGITVAYFDVNGFDDYLNMLKILTDITNRPDLYEKNGLEVQKQVEEVKKRKSGENKSILYLRGSATYLKAKNNKGSVLGEIIEDLGCSNIADSDATLLENLSMESIIRYNPHSIFIVQMGDGYDAMKKRVETMMKENPAWNTLDAVKNNRIYYMDKELYSLKPNARWGEAYEKFEELLLRP